MQITHAHTHTVIHRKSQKSSLLITAAADECNIGLPTPCQAHTHTHIHPVHE